MLNSSNLRVLSNALQAHKIPIPNPLVQFIKSSSSLPHSGGIFNGSYWFGPNPLATAFYHSQCTSCWSIIYGFMWPFAFDEMTNPHTRTFTHVQSIQYRFHCLELQRICQKLTEIKKITFSERKLKKTAFPIESLIQKQLHKSFTLTNLIYSFQQLQ